MYTQAVVPLHRQPGLHVPRSAPLPLAARVTRSALGTLSNLSVDAAAHAAWTVYTTPVRHPWPRREAAYRDSAEQFTVQTPHGAVAAYSWGQEHLLPWEARAARNTVLLVHGWSGRGTQLCSLVDGLVDRGFRVVAMDAPAHGASEGRRTNLFQFRNAIRAVGRHVGPLRAVVGHSMGGAAVVMALADGLDAEDAVLMGAPSDLSDVLDRYVEAMQLSPALRAGMLRIMQDQFGADVMERARVEALAGDLPQRGLIVHDVDDAEVPYGDAVRNAAGWKGARLISTAGLGHRKILRDGPVIQEVLQFISGN